MNLQTISREVVGETELSSQFKKGFGMIGAIHGDITSLLSL